MIMDFTEVFSYTLFVLSLLLLFSKLYYKKNKLPPGPINLPLVGNIHKIFGGFPAHRSLHELSRKYGPLMYLKQGKRPTVVASSAATAREFMKTNDLLCCSKPFSPTMEKLTYGFRDIGFAPYGDQWRVLKKISILQLFSPKKVVSSRYIREDEVDRMIASISSTCSQGSEVNLSKELPSLAINITCRALLGMDCSSREKLLRILPEARAVVSSFYFTDYIPILGWLDALRGMKARIRRTFHELDGFYQDVIDGHVGSTREHEDAIDTLLEMQKNEAGITEHHIKGFIMDTINAGSDTSAIALEWAMAEMMRKPESMKKAQLEVRALLGNKAKVEETDLHQLHYLKSVLKEILRLHPPGPLLKRETMQHCKVNGYDVPAKTLLLINVFAIGRDECVWEKPNEFRPERFLNSCIDFKGRDFQLIPFGAGRRICPAVNYAALVVELALANLLYLFDWKLPEGMAKEHVDVGESPGITVRAKSDLWLVATKYVPAN